jgi:hypothetical protein
VALQINLDSDAANCGSCGNNCTPANAEPYTCINRECSTSLVCNTGFADCNNDPADGCEVRLAAVASQGYAQVPGLLGCSEQHWGALRYTQVHT